MSRPTLQPQLYSVAWSLKSRIRLLFLFLPFCERKGLPGRNKQTKIPFLPSYYLAFTRPNPSAHERPLSTMQGGKCGGMPRMGLLLLMVLKQQLCVAGMSGMWSALGLTAAIKSERKSIDQIPIFLVCVRDKKPNYYLIDSIDSVSSYIPCLLKCERQTAGGGSCLEIEMLPRLKKTAQSFAVAGH